MSAAPLTVTALSGASRSVTTYAASGSRFLSRSSSVPCSASLRRKACTSPLPWSGRSNCHATQTSFSRLYAVSG